MNPVVHIITGLGAGGAEAMLAQLAVGLQERDMPQHVVSLAGRGVYGEALEDKGISVTDLGIGSRLSTVSGFAKLLRLVRMLKPAVIQGWMYHGNLAASAAHRFAGKNTRLMWNIRASNMDAERYGRVIKWSARLSARPDLVLTNSHASIDFHRDQGFRPKRLMVVHNGIDTEKYQPDRSQRTAMREELGIAEDAIVAAVVARVDPMKDHETFLEAIAGLDNVTGLLVGAGTEGLTAPENVIALGLRRDVERIHRCADLIVSSSAYGEGFSNALAEGMSSGLVPVATDVGDARLIVGDTGRIVPQQSAEVLGAAIAAEAELSPDALRKRGLAARQRILDNYTLERAVESYAMLYREA